MAETNNNNLTWTYKQKAKYLDDGTYVDNSNGQQVTREDLERIYGEDANMTVHASGDESAYDEWHSAHPIPLPAVEVVAKAKPKPSPVDNRSWLERKWDDGVQSFKNSFNMTFNPIVGKQRTQLYSRAMDRDPNFSANWDMAGLIHDYFNHITLGIPNRIPLSQNIGLGRTILNPNSSWSDIGNSWMGNSGVLDEETARENPRLSATLNFATDVLGGYAVARGTNSFRNYLNTEIPLGKGAESEVFTYPFRNYVIKRSSVHPDDMKKMLRYKDFARTEYLGQEGNYHLYKQQRLYMPSNPIKEYRQIAQNLSGRFKPFTHPNMDGVGFVNLSDDVVLSDFGPNGAGQIGRTRFLRVPKIADMSLDRYSDFSGAVLQRRGGRLVKNKNLKN